MNDKPTLAALAAERDTLLADIAATKAVLGTIANKTANAIADAVTADRTRYTAIMALPEARGRKALAEHLFAHDYPVDEAKAMLAVSPIAVAPTPEATPPADLPVYLAGAALAGGSSRAARPKNHGWGTAVAKVNQRNLR